MPTVDRRMTPGLVLRIFLPFAAGYFLSYVYRSVNAVMASDLTAEFALGPADLGLLTSAYFLTFAAFQLPLGLLLDRYGPRRVEAALLLFAGLGGLVFAHAEGMSGLLLGRALIGFGVSACLMGSFKAFASWFPRERLPAVNGWIMAAGGLGALAATAPVEALLGVTDWRGIFLGLAVLSFLISALVFWVVPDHSSEGSSDGLRAQLAGIRQILGDRYFWRIAPMGTVVQSFGLALPGLWAAPWLRDVAGLDRTQVADHLFALAVSILLGFLTMGNLTWRLSRRGIRPIFVAVTGIVCFLLAQVWILTGANEYPMSAWVAFGFFSTATTLCYAILSQYFDPRLAGRVNTALNLLVFIGAFVVQWGLGAIIGMWSETADGHYPQAAYQAAFGLMLLLQLLSLTWLAFDVWRSRAGVSSAAA